MGVTGMTGTIIGGGWAAAMGSDGWLNGSMDDSLAGDVQPLDVYVGSAIEDDLVTSVILSEAKDPVNSVDLTGPFATFSSAIDDGMRWLASASMAGVFGGSGSSGDPSGIGGGGSNDDNGVKRRRQLPVAAQNFTWTQLIERGGWFQLLGNGRTRVTFTFDGLPAAHGYEDAMQKIFGNLAGVVAVVCRAFLDRDPILFGAGVQYIMMLARGSGNRVSMSELIVIRDGTEKLRVSHINRRNADVTRDGVVRQYTLGMNGHPREVVPGKRTSERLPEDGRDTGPTEADADRAIVDLLTLDFARRCFADTMGSALAVLEKRSGADFDQYLSDMQKALEAYRVAAFQDSRGQNKGSKRAGQAREELERRYRIWHGSAVWGDRIAKAIERLAKNDPSVAEEVAEAPVSLPVSAYVDGADDVFKWLTAYDYEKPAAKSELSRRLIRGAAGPWTPKETKALLEALYSNGADGMRYIRAMTGESPVLMHEFENNGSGKVSVHVRPSDILPFIEKASGLANRREFKESEIGQLVKIAALLRLGAALKAKGVITVETAGEDSIKETLDIISTSVMASGKIPVVPRSVNEQFDRWSNNLRLFMATAGTVNDLVVMLPIISNTKFALDQAISDLITETGFTGRLWVIRPSGELAGDFDPAKKNVSGGVAPSEEENMIDKLHKVDSFAGLVEWLEEFLKVSVSEESIFYPKSRNEFSLKETISLVGHLATEAGEGGIKLLARMATGVERLTRSTEAETAGFEMDAVVPPDVLRVFLRTSRREGNVIREFSEEELVKIIELLAMLRIGWNILQQGRRSGFTMVEKDIASLEGAISALIGLDGVVPTPIILRLTSGEWEKEHLKKSIREELEKGPQEPRVIILDPAPSIQEIGLEELVQEVGFPSWVIVTDIGGKTFLR